MLLSELPNLIRNHLHLKVITEVGVSDIPTMHISVAPIFVMIQMDGIAICTSEHRTGHSVPLLC